MRCANASTSSVVDLGHCQRLPQPPGGVEQRSGATVVPYATLDSLVGRRSVRVLKIDCDGCEPAAYRGLSRTLSGGRVRYLLVELCGARRDATWLADLWRRYQPRAYVAKIAVNPAREGCSHFGERHVDSYTPETLRTTLLAKRRPPSDSVPRGAPPVSPAVPGLKLLVDFLQRCEDWGRSPPGFPGVSVDVLIDLQPQPS